MNCEGFCVLKSDNFFERRNFSKQEGDAETDGKDDQFKEDNGGHRRQKGARLGKQRAKNLDDQIRNQIDAEGTGADVGNEFGQTTLAPNKRDQIKYANAFDHDRKQGDVIQKQIIVGGFAVFDQCQYHIGRHRTE